MVGVGVFDHVSCCVLCCDGFRHCLGLAEDHRRPAHHLQPLLAPRPERGTRGLCLPIAASAFCRVVVPSPEHLFPPLQGGTAAWTPPPVTPPKDAASFSLARSTSQMPPKSPFRSLPLPPPVSAGLGGAGRGLRLPAAFEP